MAKIDKSQRAIDSMSKSDILESEDRKSQKHRRKRFSEYLEEDENYQNFNFKVDDTDLLDEETLAKYLRK